MKVAIIIFLLLFSGMSYGGEGYKTIFFKEAIVNIPVEWNFNEINNCLLINKEKIKASSYLKICRHLRVEGSNYFKINDSGNWEAITDGIPVLADVNVTSKFTGMSALVLCKYKDDAGYHTDQCFQAEIKSALNITFIFTGMGEELLFKEYKKIYTSFNIQ